MAILEKIGTLRVQRKSEAMKYGEGTDHERAKTRLVNILMDNGFEVFPDAHLNVAWSLESENEQSLRERMPLTDYYHEFDIYCRKRHDNGLVSELIIEIDGSSHNSKVQQGKDKTAQKYAEFFLPDAEFIRIDIGTALDNDLTMKMIEANFFMK